MKKSVKKALVTMMALASLGCMSCVNASAANTTVELDLNQTWTYVGPCTRSGRFSYLSMRNLAVYPRYGGTDNFRYIQGDAVDDNGYKICDTLTLDEQSSIASFPTIYEGYYDADTIYFRFRGNNPNYEAKADVVYSAN